MYSGVTATDVLVFWRWHDLATRETKEAQKKITITNFFKKMNFSIYKYTLLNASFVCEIFI
jgi:hypothetical protein